MLRSFEWCMLVYFSSQPQVTQTVLWKCQIIYSPSLLTAIYKLESNSHLLIINLKQHLHMRRGGHSLRSDVICQRKDGHTGEGDHASRQGGGQETSHQRREEAIEWVYITYRRGPGGGSSLTQETVHWRRRQCLSRKETARQAQRSLVNGIPVIERGHWSFRRGTIYCQLREEICWWRKSFVERGAVCRGRVEVPNTWEDTLHQERRPSVEVGRQLFIMGGRRPCIVVWIGPLMVWREGRTWGDWEFFCAQHDHLMSEFQQT